MISVSKILGPLTAGVLTMAGAPTADEPRTASPTPESTHRSAADTTERRDALDHWTTDRMRAAQPLEASAEEPPSRNAPSRQSTGDRWSFAGAVARTTGKVFVTMDGRDSTCSAAVVPAENRATVVTAGHCLKDRTGSWAQNWTFVPGYEDGKAPYGRYAAREMLVPPEWANEADDSFDFGMVVLHDSGGTHVQDRTGAQEIRFGQHPGRQTYAFGYPSTGHYDGRRLHYCSGRSEADRERTTASGMACEMTVGSSGGPWLTDFDTESGKGTVTSVVSFKYAGDLSVQYGPHFGDEARRLYETAASL